MTAANRRPAPGPRADGNHQGEPAAGPAAPPAADVAAWIASASTREVQAAWRAICAPFGYRHLLSPALLAELRELNDLLSERLCPYSTAELDAVKDELNEKYPGREHWYMRSGTAVWWCDRKKEPLPPGAKAGAHATA